MSRSSHDRAAKIDRNGNALTIAHIPGQFAVRPGFRPLSDGLRFLEYKLPGPAMQTSLSAQCRDTGDLNAIQHASVFPATQ